MLPRLFLPFPPSLFHSGPLSVVLLLLVPLGGLGFRRVTRRAFPSCVTADMITGTLFGVGASYVAPNSHNLPSCFTFSKFLFALNLCPSLSLFLFAGGTGRQTPRQSTRRGTDDHERSLSSSAPRAIEDGEDKPVEPSALCAAEAGEARH